jgi:ribosome-binding protein aMBF1 (putative translation factor)
MATIVVKQCDMCGSQADVVSVRVAPDTGPAWEVDLCESCRDRMRPAGARGPRKAATMKVKKLPPQP